MKVAQQAEPEQHVSVSAEEQVQREEEQLNAEAPVDEMVIDEITDADMEAFIRALEEQNNLV